MRGQPRDGRLPPRLRAGEAERRRRGDGHGIKMNMRHRCWHHQATVFPRFPGLDLCLIENTLELIWPHRVRDRTDQLLDRAVMDRSKRPHNLRIVVLVDLLLDEFA